MGILGLVDICIYYCILLGICCFELFCMSIGVCIDQYIYLLLVYKLEYLGIYILIDILLYSFYFGNFYMYIKVYRVWLYQVFEVGILEMEDICNLVYI